RSVQRALSGTDRDAAVARAPVRRGEEAAPVRPHPDGAAREGGGTGQGCPLPRERRLQLHDGSIVDRRRRDHRRIRDPGGSNMTTGNAAYAERIFGSALGYFDILST